MSFNDNPLIFDHSYPIDVNSTLNRGLLFWFLSLPNLFGGRFAYDLTRNTSLPGVVRNCNWSTISKPNGFGSIAFNGSSGHVLWTANSSLSLLNNFTVSVWGYANAFANQGGLVSHTNTTSGWGLVPNGSNVLSFVRFNSGGFNYISVNANPPIRKWFNLVGLIRNGTRFIFLDGVQQTATDTNLPGVNTSEQLGLGRFYSATDAFYFNGYLDDVRIYNRALSNEEIKALADNSPEYIYKNLNTYNRQISTFTLSSIVTSFGILNSEYLQSIFGFSKISSDSNNDSISNSSTSVENLLNLIKSSEKNVDFLQNYSNNFHISVENLTTILNYGLLSAEILNVINNGNVFDSENNLTISINSGINIDYLNSLISSGFLSNDWLGSFTTSGSFGISWLQSIISNGLLNVEWSGGTQFVFKDNILSIENLQLVNSDRIKNIEYLATTITGNKFDSDFLGDIFNGFKPSLEWCINLYFGSKISTDYLNNVLQASVGNSGWNLNLDFGAGLVIANQLELINGVVTSEEFTKDIRSGSTPSLDFLNIFLDNGEFNVDWHGRLLISYQFCFDFLVSVFNGRHTALIWLQSLYDDGIVPVAWGGVEPSEESGNTNEGWILQQNPNNIILSQKPIAWVLSADGNLWIIKNGETSWTLSGKINDWILKK